MKTGATRQSASDTDLPPRRRRNAAETRQRILEAAVADFCNRGYDGARMQQIVARAGCNIRMAYHYFGDKEGLYLAVLEEVYGELRRREAELDLEHLAPLDGMAALVEFTFDYMANHPEFISLVRDENLRAGQMLKKSQRIPSETTPLVGMISDTLKRGEQAGVFRRGVDPMQLYISMLALSFTHISNRHTLSIIFEKDLGDPKWLKERRAHAVDVILTYLRHDR